MASWPKWLPRLQTQNLAIGVSTRRSAASCARSGCPGCSLRSIVAARRSASMVAASLSRARSASTFFISGCSTSRRPKALRWAVWCSASVSAARISPAVPSAQSSRVSAPMARICGTPRPSSPTRQASASWNSTSLLALAWLPSLCLRRWMCSALTRPSGSSRGSRKQLSPPAACASTRCASHIGADMNHLCPVMR